MVETTVCATCINGYYLESFDVVTGVNTETVNICHKCTNNCLACTSATDCTACPYNMDWDAATSRCVCNDTSILYEGRCYKNLKLPNVTTQCGANEYEY